MFTTDESYIVKVRLAVESHPLELTPFQDYVPEEL